MTSKKILLVSALRNYPARDEMYPSGALLLLGTMLKQQGHTVKVIHMAADQVTVAGFGSVVLDFKPDIVGFTVSTYQTMVTRQLQGVVKQVCPGTVTVVGGLHPSALRGKFLTAFPSTDVVVYGEGEQALSDIAADVPLKQIAGVCYWDEDDRIVVNAPDGLRPDLDRLPLPDKSLIDFKRFSGLFPVGRKPCMFVMSSRGCPFRCTFCSKSVYGNTLRLRSPESVMTEVDLLHRTWGVKEIHFEDDTFNANRKWADELLNLLMRYNENKEMVFRVALRVNEKIVDLDLLKHLKAAGVWFVYYGVENGNQAMLDRMHKDITVDEVRRAFQLAHKAGLKTEAFFIVGMPGETPETVEDSRRLYKELRPYWGGFSRAMPFPGTEFTEEVRRSGHLLCEDYDQFEPSKMQVRTDAMSREELDRAVDAMNRMATRDKLTHPKQVWYAGLDRLTTALSHRERRSRV